MPNPETPAPAAPAARPKRRGRVKLLVFLALALTVVVAAQTGLLGFGLAHLRAATFPRDEALLEYVPGSDARVVVVDPHQLDLKALGAEGGAARAYLDRLREDVKKTAGIDLAFDVDKIAFAPSLVVARGRFSHKKLAERLAESGYQEAEHKGVKYLARAGEDAIAVIDGDILLYGDDDAAIRAGIDAEAGDTSLADRDEIMARLSEMGWNHPVLATAQLAEAKPSLRDVLAGSTGPRAVTLGLSTKGSLLVDTRVEAASPNAAEELRKLIEEKRAAAPELTRVVGDPAGQVLADVAKRAKITADAPKSLVDIQFDVTQPELETLAKAAEKATTALGDVYKNVRLFQLLAPN